jgi:RHS repeat-associated protein
MSIGQAYDNLHRLRRLGTVNDPGEELQSYDYEVSPTGLRTRQVVLELDEAGQVQAHYVRDLDLLAVRRPAEKRFFHGDGLGSVRLLTSETGSVSDRYAFSAFGELVEHEGEDPNGYLFAGEALEERSGLYHLRARWMDPNLGIFLSQDPLAGFVEAPATLHRYLYAAADPVNNTDPTGQEFGSRGLVIGLAVAGVIAAIGITYVRHLRRPAQFSGILFGKVRPIIVSKWNEAEVLTHLSYARSIMNNRAEILLRWGNLETPQDLSAETQNYVSGDPTKTEAFGLAKSGFNELKIVPVYFLNSLQFKIASEGVSFGDWEGFSWRGSFIPWHPANTSRIALAHELGHSLGDLDDRWCLPPFSPVNFSRYLMASDCTFQGDVLSDSERSEWRGHMSLVP